MGQTVRQRERLARDVETIAASMHRVSLPVLARRIGRTAAATRQPMQRQHLAPTRDCGYVTAATLSREFVALSPQSIAAKCRSGAIPARRNPTRLWRGQHRTYRRWWLIGVDTIPALQARYGARGAVATWGPGRGIHRETSPRPARLPDPLRARRAA